MAKKKEIPFAKYHGLGNDFIVVRGNDLSGSLERLARAITDRRTGVGADGVLVLSKPRHSENQARLRIFNADGSEAEMSGNGIRCVGAFLAGEDCAKGTLRIETAAGVRQLELVSSKQAARSGEWNFRVAMGRPILDPEKIPVRAGKRNGPLVGFPLRVGKHRLAATITSMGNPHCSIFVSDFSSLPWQMIGAEVERSSIFPNRTNVEFVKVVSRNKVEVRYWERGVGQTMSSGTGSCGAAVASILSGFTGHNVSIQTLAGRLRVSWPEGGEVFLTGPAKIIARGVYHAGV